MDTKSPFRISSQLVVGLAAILLGLVLLFDNMDLIDGRMYIRFWPIVLIVTGALRLAQPRRGGAGGFFSIALVVIGSVLLLNNLHVTDLGFRELWPLILVLIGASMVLGNTSRVRSVPGDTAPAEADSLLNGFAVLGAFQRSSNTQDFRGGELTAVMGGCEVDLRQATIKGDEAVINVFALWGGIKIKVPHTWSVTLQGFPLLGGFDDRTVQPADPAAKRLFIKGTSVMGGVEVIN